MKFEDDPITVTLSERKNRLTIECTPEGARSIYFALREYSDHLIKSILEAQEGEGPQMFEDLMFLGSQLGKTNEALFHLLENHTITETNRIYKWLDV